MASPCFVMLGTYTDPSILPHEPRSAAQGEGIVVGRWRASTLERLHTAPAVNPAFMKCHPRLNVLYVLSECIDTLGYLTAFALDAATGALRELGRLQMTGRSSCYVSFDRDARYAVVTSYWDARVDVVALDEHTGAPLAVVGSHQQTRRDTWRQVVNREDHMANRQDGPHAHSAIFHPSYNWLFVPDLGDNGIHQYRYKDGRLTHEAFIPVAPGDGPRHFVFHPTLPVAFSGCELKSQVQVFAFDASDPGAVRPRVSPIQRLSTLPGGWCGTNYVGEIKADAEGRRVYVSNRGHDSIATFTIDAATGLLAREGVDSTLGRCPRHFSLSPCGGYLVVGTQDSDAVRTFELCPATGRPLRCVQSLDVPCPSFVLFVTQPHPTPGSALTTGASEAREQARVPAQPIRVASPVAVCAN
ncbi:hypothetical protein Rsub_09599 [Raphidocelis subcapitata]|uniref:6-phosphogluconolactonase n=1 Tax=Raphidocelis subcapitata TaxID=307507 RepID=A0A2V0PHN9_9CHLO|nr:hypothetical protein Rsub_09599 [Raphidocelis subcapitata]|eukprot:GBF97433.1 hypothetical protein Rsub_09599 [Raphidocelis subcapitata]